MEKPAGYGVFAGTLEKWETDDLLLSAQLIEDLRSHPGFEVLERLLEERRKHTLTLLIHGPVHSHEKYAAMAAEVSGLESSLRAVEAVLFAAEVRERGEQAAAEADAREGALA